MNYTSCPKKEKKMSPPAFNKVNRKQLEHWAITAQMIMFQLATTYLTLKMQGVISY